MAIFSASESSSVLDPKVRDISLGRRTTTLSDQVSVGQPDDYFRFTLNNSSNVKLDLKNLRADADVAILSEQGEVVGFSAKRNPRASENIRVNLAPGTYYVRVHAMAGGTTYRLSLSAKGLRSPRGGRAPQLPAPDADRPVLEWNSVLLRAIAQDKTAPPVAARGLAIMNVAIHDAINSVLQFSKAYRVNTVKAPVWASADGAVAGAAYQTLINLFPNQRGFFDASLSAALAKVPDGVSEQSGFDVGVAVANQILTWRSTDGAAASVSYTPPSGYGQWQPTLPGFASALLPQWPNVTPFALRSGSQLRPAGPPSATSAQYAAEIAEVQSLGRSNSTTRTTDQTEIAYFWADGAGSYTPPGHWMEIAAQVARTKPLSLFQDTELFTTLGVALADAAIVAWDAKYHYNQWRPITAIRQTSDPTWTPLLSTPPFPDYISGHSTFSGAASTVLARFFGDAYQFSTTSMGTPGVVRSFGSFSQAANEAGRSRIYGGIHVESANQDGLAVGRLIADYALTKVLS